MEISDIIKDNRSYVENQQEFLKILIEFTQMVRDSILRNLILSIVKAITGKIRRVKTAATVWNGMKLPGYLWKCKPYLIKFSMIFRIFKMINITPIRFKNPLYFCSFDYPLRIDTCWTWLGTNAKQHLKDLFFVVNYEIFCRHFFEAWIVMMGFLGVYLFLGISYKIKSFWPCLYGLLCTNLADNVQI